MKWHQLSQTDKISILNTLNDEEIGQQYCPDNMTAKAFENLLYADRALFRPDLVGQSTLVGEPPRKDTVMGAFRDLKRAEALLELIDNSIDAWRRRRQKYRAATAPELKIFIDIDNSNRLIMYEDNAGGVSRENLPNLVIPGYSETSDADRTIGSYKTGGKKAIFKLASKANILTYYWNPIGTSDEAYSIQLDEAWLENATDYKFPRYDLMNKTEILQGQTIYKLRMHDHDEWTVQILQEIEIEIRRTYTLLMLRNPEIQIHFVNRDTPLQPLPDLYKFTAAKSETVDLRSQRVRFKTTQEWKGQEHDVEIEIVLGCRTTVSPKQGDDAWGIDIYGNDRLFKHHDTDEIFAWYDSMIAGNARNYLRGYINLHAPNILVPWDTHKRHLNSDRDIIAVLRTNGQIKEFFSRWAKACNGVGGIEEIIATIKDRLPPFKGTPGKTKSDVNVGSNHAFPLAKKRGVKLPESLPLPKLPPKAGPSGTDVEIKFNINIEEWRQLCDKFSITGVPDRDTKKQLSDAVKEYALRKR